jgi:hypothetical protein
MILGGSQGKHLHRVRNAPDGFKVTLDHIESAVMQFRHLSYDYVVYVVINDVVDGNAPCAVYRVVGDQKFRAKLTPRAIYDLNFFIFDGNNWVIDGRVRFKTVSRHEEYNGSGRTDNAAKKGKKRSRSSSDGEESSRTESCSAHLYSSSNCWDGENDDDDDDDTSMSSSAPKRHRTNEADVSDILVAKVSQLLAEQEAKHSQHESLAAEQQSEASALASSSSSSAAPPVLDAPAHVPQMDWMDEFNNLPYYLVDQDVFLGPVVEDVNSLLIDLNTTV